MYVFKFLLSMHFFSAVLIPFFLDYGKISFTTAMLLQTWFTFWAFALEIPTGAVADYISRKVSIILGTFSAAAGALTYIVYPHIYIFMLAEFLFALGIALISGADDALIYDSLKKMKKEHRAKKIFANISSVRLIAMAIGAALGGLIAGQFGVKWAMGAHGIVALATALFAFSLKEPKTKRKNESKRYLHLITEGVRYLKGHKILRMLAMDSMLIAALAFFVIWIYQLKLMELGIPIAIFGFVHAGLTGAQVLVLQNFERFEKTLKSKKKFLLYSAIITGLFLMIAGIAQTKILAIAAIMIAAGFGLSRERAFASYMNHYIESHHRATVLSSIRMIKTIGRSALYPVIALLAEWSLMYTFIILGVAIISIALMSKIEEAHLI